MKLLICFLTVFIIVNLGCTNNSTSRIKFSNTGFVPVLNGRDKTDTLKYSCDSCVELLSDKFVFDTIIKIASREAKENLRNKLSFIPISADIKVWKANNYYYTTGQKIDSLSIAVVNYKSIGKNGYGVEGEVETSSLIYLVNNQVVNLSGKIRKDSLHIVNGTVNRTLSLFENEGSITIHPTTIRGKVHLIVSSNEDCVEDARLRIVFEGGESISLNSWNEFNCKGNSYFELNQSQISTLKGRPIVYISFSEDNSVFCSVPENERDYFIQYLALIRL